MMCAIYAEDCKQTKYVKIIHVKCIMRGSNSEGFDMAKGLAVSFQVKRCLNTVVKGWLYKVSAKMQLDPDLLRGTN